MQKRMPPLGLRCCTYRLFLYVLRTLRPGDPVRASVTSAAGYGTHVARPDGRRPADAKTAEQKSAALSPDTRPRGRVAKGQERADTARTLTVGQAET